MFKELIDILEKTGDNSDKRGVDAELDNALWLLEKITERK